MCALPTLISIPSQSEYHYPFSLASPSPSSSAFDFNSLVLHNNHDCRSPTSSSLTDLDGSDCSRFASSSTSSSSTKRRRLEFVDGALASLDISFETSAAEDGKLRVRMHSGGSDPYTGPSASSALGAFDPLSSPIHGSASPTSALSHSVLSDPFLGATSAFGGADAPGSGPLAAMWYDGSSSYSSALDLSSLGPSSWTSPFSSPLSSAASSSSSSLDDCGFGWGVANGANVAAAHAAPVADKQRRVRIALKSWPAPGGEGGEWEVQLC